MSLRPQSVLPPVPEDTSRIAQTAFRRGNLYSKRCAKPQSSAWSLRTSSMHVRSCPT